MLAFLNHFPLFAMMLRVKDPQRLPGGLAFSVVNEGAGTYLLMKVSDIVLMFRRRMFSDFLIEQPDTSIRHLPSVLGVVD